MSPREIAKECTYNDIKFVKGERVFFMFSSANRDEEFFDNPDCFDLSRDLRPTVTFGAGPHYCAGAWVSRALIADIALPKVFDRLENLKLTKGLIFSQELMLELTKTGLSREKSYKIIQAYAKKCFTENLNLFDVIQSDRYIMSKISPKKLKNIFSYSKHFKNVNLIFRRVFK